MLHRNQHWSTRSHRCQTSGLACNGSFERLSFNKKLPFSPNLRCATTVECSVDRAGNIDCQPIRRAYKPRDKSPRAKLGCIVVTATSVVDFGMLLDRATALGDLWAPSIYDIRSAVQLFTGTRFSAMKAKESFDGNRASVHSHATGCGSLELLSSHKLVLRDRCSAVTASSFQSTRFRWSSRKITTGSA